MLLAYLVLNRSRHIAREELIGSLWPENPPLSQDAALRTLLSRLRSAVGGAVLVGRDQLHLELLEPAWIDVEAAESEVGGAQEALERGDARVAWALAQVPLNIASRGLLPGSEASWLEPWRRELEHVRLQALEVIGRAGLSLGGTQLGSVERAARGLIETEPYRESGYVLLMQALAARGNVAEGLRVFERLRALLRDELGTAPSPETIAAHERLLHPARRQARAISDGGSVREGPTIALPAELVARGAAPLVGRVRELATLDRGWELARDAGQPCGEGEGDRGGQGDAIAPESAERFIVLAGDPGIGKTRLIAELARRAHQSGAVVLAGRSPQDTLVPYQPFLEALRHYLLSLSLSELRSTAREYGSELALLIPELRRRIPDLPPPLSSEPETARYRLFEAVVGLLAEISALAPALLVLDDLHWADRPTLLLLRHLARAPAVSRLMILGAYRPTEPSSDDGFAALLADLRRERLVTQLEIRGLAEAETEELIKVRTGVTPSRVFSEALHEETEGNPLFIEEIVRHLVDAGVQPHHAGARELQRFGLPEGVKEVIARRLARLDDKAIEWLRVAAVTGRDFDAALLERILSFDEDEFLGALDEGLGAGLVVESADHSGRYSFSHALIRETLYEGMSEARRTRIHRRVGNALEGAGAGHLNELALHFTRAAEPRDAERAIGYALRAGEQATAMLAHEEAADHYQRALEVLERADPDALAKRCELLLLLGEAQVRTGDQPVAWQTFREAASAAAQLGDRTSLARAAIGASRRYVQPPGVVDEELIAMLEQALAMTTDERTVMRVRLLGRLCGALYYSPRREQMKQLSAEATAIAVELADPESRALAAAARRRAFWDAAHLPQRLADSTELLRCAREAGDVELALQGHAWLVVDLLEQGDSSGVDAQMEAFNAGARRLRQPLYLWNAALWQAMRALLEGRLQRAEELASDALAAGLHGERAAALQYYAIQLFAIRREQGRMTELEEPARELVEANPHRPSWRTALAMLLCETGRIEEGRREFDALAANDFADLPQDGEWMITVILLADSCTELGDSERAARLYDLLLPYRDCNVVIGLAAVCLGSAARYLGRLAGTMGQPTTAVEHLRRALEVNAALKAPVHLAHTQLDYARALAPGPEAQALIDQAASSAQELALPAVARRAAEPRRA